MYCQYTYKSVGVTASQVQVISYNKLEIRPAWKTKTTVSFYSEGHNPAREEPGNAGLQTNFCLNSAKAKLMIEYNRK